MRASRATPSPTPCSVSACAEARCPCGVFHDSFVAQIAGQGMGADYLATLETAANPGMLVAMFAATFVAGLIAPYIARGMFKKHFVKAGLA